MHITIRHYSPNLRVAAGTTLQNGVLRFHEVVDNRREWFRILNRREPLQRLMRYLDNKSEAQDALRSILRNIPMTSASVNLNQELENLVHGILEYFRQQLNTTCAYWSQRRDDLHKQMTNAYILVSDLESWPYVQQRNQGLLLLWDEATNSYDQAIAELRRMNASTLHNTIEYLLSHMEQLLVFNEFGIVFLNESTAILFFKCLLNWG